jgi:site-specific DNA recombinase
MVNLGQDTSMNTDYKFFTYCRKSSEDSQRQIASIEDQVDSSGKMVGAEGLNLVASPFKEEKSAKDPGRPVFNEMLARIEKGEANAILCWDIDRLYRNPVDEGRVRWMLQKGIIKVIRTPYRQFYPEDAGLLMGVEGGRATDYVIRLSKNVKRGQNSRVAKGWRPNLAPIGYLNKGDKGDKTIIVDEKTFQIVRKAWDLFLTGTYQVPTILDIANKQWGLRTTLRRKLGGKPLSRSQLYKIFIDPFYYGSFWWKNPETGKKELMKGNHTPMITEKEYMRAQVLLGRKGKPQPKTREFYATGLIKCGECDGTVTAEEKYQLICTHCKNKFGYEGKTACPKCATDISEMKNPSMFHYIYYRCTKKIKKDCSQKTIRLEELESQFKEALSAIKIDEDYLKVALEYLNEKQNNSGNDEKKIRDLLQEAYNNIQTRLKNLQREFTSPQNVNYDLYTPEEYTEHKKALIKERGDIESKMTEVKTQFDDSIEATERTFTFCAFALAHFDTPDIQKKRNIFSTIGSNLILKDRKLIIERLHPYLLIENELKAQKVLLSSLELTKRGSAKRKEAVLAASNLNWRMG